MRRWLPLLAPVLMAACQPRPAPAPEAKAEREKVLVYSPHGREVLEPFEKRFEEAHPEIDMQWLDMGSSEVLERIRAEKANPAADVWWGAPHTMFADAAEEGLLEPYRPTWADAIDESRRDPQDRWYGQWLTPAAIVYNAEALKLEEAPQDWDDLLKPEWKDKILIRDPLNSGTMRTFIAAMVLRQPTVEEGYRWLLKLDHNTKAYPANPALLHRQIATREGLVTVWNLRDAEIQRRVNGYPLGYVLPKSGSPVVTDAIALVKGAPHLEAAKTFYEYVTAPEQLYWAAEQFDCLPARHDIDRTKLPARMPQDIKELPLDWERIGAEGDAWATHWDRAIRGQGRAGGLK